MCICWWVQIHIWAPTVRRGFCWQTCCCFPPKKDPDPIGGKNPAAGHCRTCGMCRIHGDEKVPGQPKKRRDACNFPLCTRHHEIIGLLELSPFLWAQHKRADYEPTGMLKHLRDRRNDIHRNLKKCQRIKINLPLSLFVCFLICLLKVFSNLGKFSVFINGWVMKTYRSQEVL